MLKDILTIWSDYSCYHVSPLSVSRIWDWLTLLSVLCKYYSALMASVLLDRRSVMVQIVLCHFSGIAFKIVPLYWFAAA